MEAHRSDSSTQREAELLVLTELSSKLGVELEQSVRLSCGSATVELDAASSDHGVLVEVFARVGRLRGGQLHKVSTDALKLIALARERPEARCILAFASHEAADSVVGWRAEAIKAHGIEIVVAEPDNAAREEIRSAQRRQRMVNADDPTAGSAAN